MQKFLLIVTLQFYAFFSFSQVFTGYGGRIRDDASQNFYKQTITGLASSTSTKFGVMGVTVNIKHQFDADLNMFLIAPDKTVIELSTGNGGNGKNYDNCVFTNNVNTKTRGI